MPNVLTLKFPAVERYAQTSRLEVSFARVSVDELSVGVFATFGAFNTGVAPLEFKAETLCYGCDLSEFACDLEKLHARYDGSARFLNQLETFGLILAIANKGQGILTVAARYVHETGGISPVEFRCFQLEQSYLPGLLADIRRFLAESGVSTKHPSEPGRSA